MCTTIVTYEACPGYNGSCRNEREVGVDKETCSYVDNNNLEHGGCGNIKEERKNSGSNDLCSQCKYSKHCEEMLEEEMSKMEKSGSKN